ncbi:MAG: fatty acid desaturase [Verrucomicrobia bacterium]|nr:fatty acid desaturase [Verrucomicrobiota bacterium]
MNTISSADHLLETSRPHWVSRAAFPIVTVIFFLNEGALGVAVYYGCFWLALLLLLTASHLMHGLLIGFHEASHGLLRKSRRLNEIDGIIIGVFSLMSFSLYRAAHQLHHAFLATERDIELWPFVIPGMPRWIRVLAGFLELSFGLLFTPFLFIRTFLRAGSPIRNRKLRRRIWAEYALTVGVWICFLAAVTYGEAWKYFLWLYLAPAFLAANLQSWRKYIEHVGLTGSTVNSSTRSIVSEGPLGRLVALTLLHEPYHGVHHRHAGLPHAELPQLASELEPKNPSELSPFPSYRHALLDLLRSLPDPRVGAQWLKANPHRGIT